MTATLDLPTNGIRSRGSPLKESASLTDSSTVSDVQLNFVGDLTIHIATLNCW